MTSAIILAGGLGTRLRSVVTEVPKPMAPIQGRPFLEYQMDYWIDQGIDHFVLSVGYLKNKIIDHFGDKYKGIAVDYAVEETPLGTGGGLLLAMKRLNPNNPFLVLNGDTFFEVQLKQLESFFNENDADLCFSLFRTSEQGRYMGIELDETGRIVSLKAGDATPGRYANGGVYLINPRSLSGFSIAAGMKISLEEDIFDSLLREGRRLYGCEFKGSFVDIGIPNDYFRSFDLITKRKEHAESY